MGFEARGRGGPACVDEARVSGREVWGVAVRSRGFRERAGCEGARSEAECARVSARAGVGVKTRVCARGSGSVGVTDGRRACGEWPRPGGRCELRGRPRVFVSKARGSGGGLFGSSVPSLAGRGERSGDRCPVAGPRGGGKCPLGWDRNRDRCPRGGARGEGPGQVPP